MADTTDPWDSVTAAFDAGEPLKSIQDRFFAYGGEWDDVRQYKTENQTLLMYLVAGNNGRRWAQYGPVMLLDKKYGDPFATDDDGCTILDYAAHFCNDAALTDILGICGEKYGVGAVLAKLVHHRNGKGDYPLSFAVSFRWLQGARQLLDFPQSRILAAAGASNALGLALLNQDISIFRFLVGRLESRSHDYSDNTIHHLFHHPITGDGYSVFDILLRNPIGLNGRFIRGCLDFVDEKFPPPPPPRPVPKSVPKSRARTH